MNTKIGLALIGTLLVTLAFQNCGRVQFELTEGRLVAKADTDLGPVSDGVDMDTPKDDNVVDDRDLDNDVGDDTDSNNDYSNRPTPNPTPDRGSNSDDDSKDVSKEQNDHDSKRQDDVQNKDHEKDSGEGSGDHGYVCVVAGSGKSHKIAFLSHLQSKEGTPSEVCMSRVACEEIISQVFEVKGAAKRGFCPNKNPHVIEMSDAQIQELVDALK